MEMHKKKNFAASPVLFLKNTKHFCFIAGKSLRKAPDRIRALKYGRKSFIYDPSRYEFTTELIGRRPLSSTFNVNHLWFTDSPYAAPTEPIPHKLFLFWTGDNPMSPPREKALESIRSANLGLEVILVDNSNLNTYIKQEWPLHKSYQNLSFIHRSDYLRAYFMHHHGGIYCDLKEMQGSWLSLIERANSNNSIWACGPSEIKSGSIDPATGPLGDDQKNYFSKVLFQAAFAFKPRSEWTYFWLKEVERRLDYFSDALSAHPAEQPFGLNSDYPVPWYSLLAQVHGPLALKYSSHALIDNSIKFIYRSTGHR